MKTEHTVKTTPKARIRDQPLDGLRAIAIIMVLLYHLFPETAPLGYLGVDVFFVLSGVFIARQVGHADARPVRYLWQRLIRLWPPIIVMVMVVLAAGWFTLLPGEYYRLGTNVLAVITFTGNFLIQGAIGYFGPGASEVALMHMWSLGVEMQTYIAAALFLPLALRVVSLPILLAGILLTSLIYTATTFDNSEVFLRSETFFDPAARAAQFALGGLAGLGRRFVPEIPNAGKTISFLLIAGAFLQTETYSHGIAAITASLMAAGFILFTLPRGATGNTGITPFAWLGRASYGTYLWHWPIIVITDQILLTERTIGISLALAGVSIALGALSFILVEHPLDRIRRETSIFPTMALFGLAAISTLMVGVSIQKADGVATRLSDDAAGILKEIRPAHPRKTECHVYRDHPSLWFSVEDACRYNESNGTVKTALIGDSHANSLAGGLIEAGLPFVEYSYSACPITPNLYPEKTGKKCPRRTERAIRTILSDPDMETVIIASRWAYYTQPRFDNGRGGRDRFHTVVMRDRQTGKTVSDLIVRLEMRKTIERLLRSGLKVVVVGPTPMFGWNIKPVIARMLWHDIDLDLAISRDILDERRKSITSMLENIKGANYTYIDPMPLFCSDETCWPYHRNGTVFFEDQDHVSFAGAVFLADYVLEQMKAARRGGRRSESER